MTEINYKPIFDYIDEKIEGLSTKEDIQSVLSAIDAFAKQSNTREQEQVILKAKTEKIEHWVIDASNKIQLPYQA